MDRQNANGQAEWTEANGRQMEGQWKAKIAETEANGQAECSVDDACFSYGVHN